jgi:hypothetical protein
VSDEALVESEVSATIKLVLTLLEQASRETPLEALEPVQFNARRRAIIRRVWALAKLASRLEEPLP